MNKIFNLVVFIVFLLLCGNFGHAQNYTKRQEFAVMNPNSYEISKFDLTPLNQYTGKASVNYPLFSMNLDGKEIPFNLSYDTGGVRVGQESTWVGLGWNLGGIPVITHHINQKSDIGNKPPYNQRGFCYEPVLPANGMTQAYLDWINSGQYNGTYGEPDTQPDVFVANLSGSVVKYQLTQKLINGSIEAKILNNSQAKIAYNETNQTFTITDENGFVYEFTHVEYTTTWTQPAATLGNEVDPTSITGAYQDDTNYNDNAERLIPTAWYVDRIVAPNGDFLDFIYEYESDGVPNVTLSHAVYSSSKKISLCGSDFNNGNIGNYWNSGFFEDVTASRSIQEVMVLSEIAHSSSGNKAVFNLGTRNDISGYTGSTQILDGFTAYTNSYDGVPKKLNSIDIKTAANTTVKHIDFQQSYFNDYKLGTAEEKSYVRLRLDGFKIFDQQYAFLYQCPDALPAKHSKDVDFWGFYNGANNQYWSAKIEISSDLCPYSNPEVMTNITQIQGAIKGSNSEFGLIGSLQEIRLPTGGTTKFEYEPNTFTINVNNYDVNMDDLVYPYLLQHNLEPGYPKNGVANANLRVFAVGGLRISEVTNTDSGGNPLLRKRYNYNEIFSGVDEVSTGKLMDGLHYYRISNEMYEGGNVQLANLTVHNNNIVNTNGSAMGGHIGYSKVEEYLEHKNLENQDLGRIITSYLNTPNESLRADPNGGAPYIVESPPVNYEDANGQMLSQIIYDANNVLKKEVNVTYEIRENFLAPGYKVYYGNLTNFLMGAAGTQHFVSDYYDFTPAKYLALPATTTTTEYMDSGEAYVTNTSNVYNSKDGLLSTEQINSFGGGNVVKTEYRYPWESSYGINGLSGTAALVAANRISQPIYTRSYNNGQLVGHQYTEFGLKNGNYEPIAIYHQKLDATISSMERKVSYERYDAYGNLCQYKQEDGIWVSAIWGYNGQYVVAKVENATYAQIEALAAFGSNFDLGNNGLSASQETQLRGLADAMVTTYDYAPLVGPVTITDSRDYSTNYQYDINNRLVAITDESGDLIQDYEYEIADVGLYQYPPVSSCLDPLDATISVTNNTVQYVSLSASVSGGVGDYTFKWYLGIGTSSTSFESTPAFVGSGIVWEICCYTQQFIKLEVTSGQETVTRVIENPNYDPNCPANSCDNPY
ncbi:hypothetical protein [Flagellimonas beolgyonensis]|jgi:hypothetical protein|uniref:hypothetical protein n=1 Tax=Flagellimonas beolgyonensis TaxID=864064 RepID=UPI000F8E815B|nr:hypothetical protein [Allomuricauda beolgyonensis]